MPEQLKRTRERLRLTQAQLATELGVHQVTVARWETGVHRIPGAVALLVRRLAADAGRGGQSRKRS
jgi:DNA-binding transcriptional regulator YiaG